MNPRGKNKVSLGFNTRNSNSPSLGFGDRRGRSSFNHGVLNSGAGSARRNHSSNRLEENRKKKNRNRARCMD
jgi:hypothetical protein